MSTFMYNIQHSPRNTLIAPYPAYTHRTHLHLLLLSEQTWVPIAMLVGILNAVVLFPRLFPSPCCVDTVLTQHHVCIPVILLYLLALGRELFLQLF